MLRLKDSIKKLEPFYYQLYVAISGNYFCWDFHLQKWICAGSKEDDTGKKEDEDKNQDKEVKVVCVTAKHLMTDELWKFVKICENKKAKTLTVKMSFRIG